jgi:hypothetical protein
MIAAYTEEGPAVWVTLVCQRCGRVATYGADTMEGVWKLAELDGWLDNTCLTCRVTHRADSHEYSRETGISGKAVTCNC